MIIIVGTNRGLAWVPKAILSPSPSDMCAEKFPLVSMGGRAEGLSASGILLLFLLLLSFHRYSNSQKGLS